MKEEILKLFRNMIEERENNQNIKPITLAIETTLLKLLIMKVSQMQLPVGMPKPNPESEVLALFVKGARQLKLAVDEKYLFHSMICNFPESHNYADGTFCNCGITDVIYAYRQYEKLSDK